MTTLPKQVWLLTITYALMLSGASVIILTAGIVGIRIAPSPGLATLPVALAILGVASMTLPVGFLMVRLGRKKVFLIFAGVAVFGALLASWSLSIQSFGWFCLSTFWLGSTGAAAQQYRFAAVDCVSGDQIPKAVSACPDGWDRLRLDRTRDCLARKRPLLGRVFRLFCFAGRDLRQRRTGAAGAQGLQGQAARGRTR